MAVSDADGRLELATSQVEDQKMSPLLASCHFLHFALCQLEIVLYIPSLQLHLIRFYCNALFNLAP